ncbi:hypothetical protein V8E51_018446 [Hyaloscypha variabilis]
MEGYEKLAQLMGNSRTDGHFLIFQKFESLSAQNILYLQAEIVNLQETLGGLAKENAESDCPERKKIAQDWWSLSSAKDCEQWETFLHLRRTLKEYYEAIAQHQMISSIPQPHKSDLKFLQRWLERPNMGNCSLVGADRRVYDTNTFGLGSLASKHGNIDPLTSLLLYSLPNLYHRLIVRPLYRLLGTWVKKPEGYVSDNRPRPSNPSSKQSVSEVERCSSATVSTSQNSRKDSCTSQYPSKQKSFDLESNIFLYRDSYFHRIASIVGTLISSLIPICSIVVLYFITDMPMRLIIVGIFTAIFSIALSLMTSGTRVEIFAATAAFASVQVVFVGSTTNL